MGRQFIHGEVLSMARQKTGVPFDIPVLADLREELDLQPLSERHLTFLVTEQGKPFTAAGFGNWFRDRCDEAGLTHCAAHGSVPLPRLDWRTTVRPPINLCRGSAGAR
jgi:hypothetical protein